MTTKVQLDDDYRRLVVDHFHDVDAEVLAGRIDAVLQFLYLASTTSGVFIPLSRAADDVWHEMIVQTRHYMRFCKSLPGGKYIHHQSIGLEDYSAERTPRSVARQFLEWIPRRIEHFGPFVREDADNWVVVDFLMKEYGFSIDAINSLA